MDGADAVRGGNVRYGPQNKAASSSTSRPAALLKKLFAGMPARRGNPAHLPRSLRPGNRQPHAGRHRARQNLPPGLGRRLRLPARLLGRGPVQGVQLYGNYAYVDARIREAGLNKGLCSLVSPARRTRRLQSNSENLPFYQKQEQISGAGNTVLCAFYQDIMLSIKERNNALRFRRLLPQRGCHCRSGRRCSLPRCAGSLARCDRRAGSWLFRRR